MHHIALGSHVFFPFSYFLPILQCVIYRPKTISLFSIFAFLQSLSGIPFFLVIYYGVLCIGLELVLGLCGLVI